jgi:Mitochondrial carrier protein
LTGTIDAFTKIWADEGMHGVFRGSIPRVIWYIPASAFTFMAVEFLRDHFNKKLESPVGRITGLSMDPSSKVREVG